MVFRLTLRLAFFFCSCTNLISQWDISSVSSFDTCATVQGEGVTGERDMLVRKIKGEKIREGNERVLGTQLLSRDPFHTFAQRLGGSLEDRKSFFCLYSTYRVLYVPCCCVLAERGNLFDSDLVSLNSSSDQFTSARKSTSDSESEWVWHGVSEKHRLMLTTNIRLVWFCC